jgi:hypothetical protein
MFSPDKLGRDKIKPIVVLGRELLPAPVKVPCLRGFVWICLGLLLERQHQEPQQTNKKENPEEAAYYRKTNLEPISSNSYPDKKSQY